ATTPNLKKGYVGGGIGIASTIKNYSDIEGKVQYGINAGYLFGSNAGIAVTYMHTSYKVDISEADVDLKTNAILAGPLFSVPFSKLECDIRPYLGFLFAKLNASSGGTSLDFKADNTIFVYGSGITLRWNVHKLISLSLNIDAVYHGSGIKFDELGLETEKLSTISMGIGLNFRF
ncbi:MAG: porin family protein, partial [Prevotellaceae bacterium]|nr:porin family protein [Prevotellaceae bacterium]